MAEMHRKKGPASFLVNNIHLLPRGRVLDVAMGSGENAVYLAGMGFEVNGVDISREAIKMALALAHDSGVSITARVADLEDGYQIRKDYFDVIICFNYLQRSLIQQLKHAIRPGGMVVYETFIVDQARFGRPKNPDHLLGRNELLDLFRDFRCLCYHEGIPEPRRAVAGIVAEKT